MSAYCPIGTTRIDQSIVRAVAFQVLCFITLFLWLDSDYLLIYLVFDFFMRGFISRQLSPLVLIAKCLKRWVPGVVVPVNAEPKVFAARLGFIICLLILFSKLLNLPVLIYVLSACLILAASLECFFSICLGCHIFSFINRERISHAVTEGGSINKD